MCPTDGFNDASLHFIFTQRQGLRAQSGRRPSGTRTRSLDRLEDIPLTAEWQQEILVNIENAENFIFVISPESAASTNCRKEIDHAVANNKRMFPIWYRAVPDDAIPEALAKFQRMDFHEGDHFESKLAALIAALDTDLPWVQMHTRLLARAKEWERQTQDVSFLLGGTDLREAEQWAAKSAEKEPKPTIFSESEEGHISQPG